MNLHELSNSTRESFHLASLDAERIIVLIRDALSEDLAGGEDVTSMATIAPTHRSTAEYRTRAAGVVSGISVVVAVLEMVGLKEIELLQKDGNSVVADSVLIRVTGNTREILLAERTSLNFLSHLSGISTLTRKWVDAVSSFPTKIRDTRKTTPGFRELEKYAVRMGGGTNHRMSLNESALIKDNHIVAAGGISEAFSKVRSAYPTHEIEVEVDTLDQLSEIIALNPDLVLLDNMSVEECAEAVTLVSDRFPLEASGGLTIENAREYAQTGVDFLAVGALTHSAKVLDIGLDLKAEI